MEKCKYDTTINILCRLKEGDLLITKMTSSINTIIKNGLGKNIMLGHLSKENNFPDLAFATSKNVLANNNMIIGKDLNLEVLSRDEVSKVFEL